MLENRFVRIGQVELANRRLQPLGHLSGGAGDIYLSQLSIANSTSQESFWAPLAAIKIFVLSHSIRHICGNAVDVNVLRHRDIAVSQESAITNVTLWCLELLSILADRAQ
jgi:hypothetical protein